MDSVKLHKNKRRPSFGELAVWKNIYTSGRRGNGGGEGFVEERRSEWKRTGLANLFQSPCGISYQRGVLRIEPKLDAWNAVMADELGEGEQSKRQRAAVVGQAMALCPVGSRIIGRVSRENLNQRYTKHRETSPYTFRKETRRQVKKGNKGKLWVVLKKDLPHPHPWKLEF